MSAEVNVADIIDGMERRLAASQDRDQYRSCFAILRSWQHDEDLTQRSRERAAEVLKKYEGRCARLLG